MLESYDGISKHLFKGGRPETRTQFELILFFLRRPLEEGSIPESVEDKQEERYKTVSEACSAPNQILDGGHLDLEEPVGPCFNCARSLMLLSRLDFSGTLEG